MTEMYMNAYGGGRSYYQIKKKLARLILTKQMYDFYTA